MAESDLITLDGERTRLEGMDLDAPHAVITDQSVLLASFAKLYELLALVMAGMYIGLNCYGSPHAHRKGDAPKNKPDNRLI